MSDYFWMFLTVAAFMGLLLPIVAIFTKHKQTMKELEIESLKIQKDNSQVEDKKE